MKHIYAIYALNGFCEERRVIDKPLYTNRRKAKAQCNEYQWVKNITNEYNAKAKGEYHE